MNVEALLRELFSMLVSPIEALNTPLDQIRDKILGSLGELHKQLTSENFNPLDTKTAKTQNNSSPLKHLEFIGNISSFIDILNNINIHTQNVENTDAKIIFSEHGEKTLIYLYQLKILNLTKKNKELCIAKDKAWNRVQKTGLKFAKLLPQLNELKKESKHGKFSTSKKTEYPHRKSVEKSLVSQTSLGKSLEKIESHSRLFIEELDTSIEQLMGSQAFDDPEENASQGLNWTQDFEENLEFPGGPSREDLFKKLNNLENLIKDNEIQINNSNEKNKELETKISELEEFNLAQCGQINKLEDEKKEIMLSIESSISKTKQMVTTLEPKIETLINEKTQSEKKEAELRNELNTLEGKNRQIDQEKDRLSQNIFTLKEQNLLVQQEIVDLQENLTNAEKKQVEFDAETTLLRKNLNELSNKNSVLEGEHRVLQQKMLTLNQQIDHSKENNLFIKNQISQLEKNLDLINNIKELNENLENEKTKYIELQKELKSLEVEKTQYEKENPRIGASLESLGLSFTVRYRNWINQNDKENEVEALISFIEEGHELSNKIREEIKDNPSEIKNLAYRATIEQNNKLYNQINQLDVIKYIELKATINAKDKTTYNPPKRQVIDLISSDTDLTDLNLINSDLNELNHLIKECEEYKTYLINSLLPNDLGQSTLVLTLSAKQQKQQEKIQKEKIQNKILAIENVSEILENYRYALFISSDKDLSINNIQSNIKNNISLLIDNEENKRWKARLYTLLMRFLNFFLEPNSFENQNLEKKLKEPLLQNISTFFSRAAKKSLPSRPSAPGQHPDEKNSNTFNR